MSKIITILTIITLILLFNLFLFKDKDCKRASENLIQTIKKCKSVCKQKDFTDFSYDLEKGCDCYRITLPDEISN